MDVVNLADVEWKLNYKGETIMCAEKKSYFETVVDSIKDWLLENKAPFFSTMLIGLMAHMFMFTTN